MTFKIKDPAKQSVNAPAQPSVVFPKGDAQKTPQTGGEHGGIPWSPAQNDAAPFKLKK